jgi:hypothetical protein
MFSPLCYRNHGMGGITLTITVSGQVAGYAVTYDVSGPDGMFEFITIKGGRHEVS